MLRSPVKAVSFASLLQDLSFFCPVTALPDTQCNGLNKKIPQLLLEHEYRRGNPPIRTPILVQLSKGRGNLPIGTPVPVKRSSKKGIPFLCRGFFHCLLCFWNRKCNSTTE